MNTYETHHIIEGRGAVTMVLDLDQLQALVNSTQRALEAANFTRAVSGTITRSRGTERRYTSGFGVFTSKQFSWAQVRNFNKAGQEISAAKYLPALLSAGIEAELKGNRISLKVELTEKVGA